MLEQLRLWHGGLRAEAGHFTGWNRGARFYPVLYMMTRAAEARDWGTGLPLKANLLGKMSKLEVHHIFPKSVLYKAKEHSFRKPEVNALGNFCFLTKNTNLKISNQLPEKYFPEIEDKHPGALASQWIPNDSRLWKIERFRDFLEARKELLAAELNQQMENLLHGDTRWLSSAAAGIAEVETVVGGISDEEEEQALADVDEWVTKLGLQPGEFGYDLSDPETGTQVAVLDLAWPDGLQQGLSEPVALLLNEEVDTTAAASQAGFRCFTNCDAFRKYVGREIIGEDVYAAS